MKILTNTFLNKLEKIKSKREKESRELQKTELELKNLKESLVDNKNYFKIDVLDYSDYHTYVISKDIYDIIKNRLEQPLNPINPMIFFSRDFQEFNEVTKPFIQDKDYFYIGRNYNL